MNILQREPEERRRRNRARLSDKIYCSPDIFSQGGEWPGDWQGRALLALACHYKMAQKEAERRGIFGQAQSILRELPFHTNEDGYFGDLFDENCVNEQQLSGNSWFLRGLCMWYEITGSEELGERLNRISERLLRRLIPAYRRYPIGRREEGSVDGHLQKEIVDGWRLSSDVGCAFILLDGITDVYEKTKDASLAEVIRAMISVFDKIDYVGSNCQTHATLSATRGIMRFWKNTGESAYFERACGIFRKYCECGMTANYANFNWFGKPFWTEPCAVADSMILAVQLYRATGEYLYAQAANRIYENAFRRAQRPNGGAGCDSCLTEGNAQLKTLMYEAYFCCTMRYAEGLLCLFENAVFERDGKIVVLFAESCLHGDLRIDISERDKMLCIKIGGVSQKPLSVYVPFCAQCARRGKDGFAAASCGDTLEIELLQKRERHAGLEVQMLGDYVLLKGPDGICRGNTDFLSLTEEEAGTNVYEVCLL